MPKTKVTHPREWVNHLVIYGIDIETFMDSDGDGVGDIKGLITKLDYIAGLGANCIWLLPFYLSPNGDNGYDVVDHCNIDPRQGTLADFHELIAEAHKRGLKIVIDYVYHHTSDEHPWFQASRVSEKSKFRDYYIWQKIKPKFDKNEISNYPAMPGEQNGVWSHDPVAQAYYYHRFYDCEPDLNVANPEVQKELLEIAEFWLAFGVDGFRVDAASMMFQKKSIPGTQMTNAGEFMEKLRDLVMEYNPEGLLLAEADVAPNEMTRFVKDGKRMDLLLNFILNAYIYHSLTSETHHSMYQQLQEQAKLPAGTSWVNFLRNLDELNIERLPKRYQNDVFKIFAPHPDMKVYDRGIRRRLAPMVEGNVTRIKMAFSLLCSLPGALLIGYGDEIGMGDNQSMPGRIAVRTPMQWSPDENGGFSQARPDKVFRQPIDVGHYGFQKINVAQQLSDPSSVLTTVRNMLAVRAQIPAITAQTYQTIETKANHVVAMKYGKDTELVVMLTNLAEKTATIKLEEVGLEDCESLLASDKVELTENEVTLPSYGYVWLKAIDQS